MKTKTETPLDLARKMERAYALRNREIVRRHAAGETFREIAEEFGISYQRVHFICTRAERQEEAKP